MIIERRVRPFVPRQFALSTSACREKAPLGCFLLVVIFVPFFVEVFGSYGNKIYTRTDKHTLYKGLCTLMADRTISMLYTC